MSTPEVQRITAKLDEEVGRLRDTTRIVESACLNLGSISDENEDVRVRLMQTTANLMNANRHLRFAVDMLKEKESQQ